MRHRPASPNGCNNNSTPPHPPPTRTKTDTRTRIVDSWPRGFPTGPNTLHNVEFLVEHATPNAANTASTVHLTFTPDESLTTVTDALALAANAGPDAPIWLHGTTAARREIFTAAGFVSNRTLLQMRAQLPISPVTLDTRAFTADDINQFVAVNNRAFHWHPEQSGLTPDDVRNDMAADWFDPDGFRLHHIDGELAGFCWTKIHREIPGTQDLGEIYVIAVDPAFHGKGLGKALTLAGLDWLTNAGLATAMLYVEDDNVAAVSTYERIGFTTYRTDTLWHPSTNEGSSIQ